MCSASHHHPRWEGSSSQWRYPNARAMTMAASQPVASSNGPILMSMLATISIAHLLRWRSAYMMSLVRWVTTTHDGLWNCLVSLVWALCPVANYAYVADWWSDAIGWVF